ncbi:uncharacterized protein BYT42DRAFT_543949 [Radiomyces spectabilis]|uniref:uncharacterized protein n=1 Tax=Radiomyces spectabilis TaxID=64574 RepID=UPI00221E3842|nr:uncharacterized protein BYT42DRAFT_543949 [Radiomyces spectabilis]KAI8388698.1 hypothetical protein BYT42DRAFT_543949 [Radiomyces spectabilis]
MVGGFTGQTKDRPSDNGRPSFYRRRSSSRSHHQSSSDMDTSEAKRRHRYTSKIDANAVHRRPPYHTRNSTDSYHDEPQESEPTSTQPSMTQRASPSSSEANTFSWQYLSMKQNPKIKRNAMHAYITYMIYTDMAQERSRVEAAIATNGTTMHDYRAEPATIMGYASETKENDPPPYGVRRSFEDETRKAYASMDQSPSVAAAAIRTEPNHSMIETTPYSNHHGGLAMAHPGDGLHHRPGVTETSWYANTMSAASYRLPPSPNQRYDGIPPTVGYPTSAPSSSSIMGRPLTAFLWDEPGSAPSAAHPERRHESVTLPPLTRPFSSMPVNADFDRSHML